MRQTEDESRLLLEQGFRLGNWQVDPSSNRLQLGEERECQVGSKAMDLLVFLAGQAGQTVLKDDIFSAVWPDTFVTEHALWKRISELRKILEEDPGNPELIITVPGRGYRLEITPVLDSATSHTLSASTEPDGIGPISQGSGGASIAAIGPKPVGRHGMARLGGAVAVPLLLLLGLGSWFRNGFDSSTSSETTQKRPTVLLVPLDNRSGNELLDGTLEVVLEGRLNDSGGLQMVSRSRVNDMLRLMRKPSTTTLTADIAHEVSARDGMIDYVVTGRIDKLEKRYQVSLRLLEGESGDLVASNDLSTDSVDELIDLAERQSSWLLDRLQVPVANRELLPERVTTRSLEALKLYTQGFSTFFGSSNPRYRSRNELAAQFFQDAIRIDPEFASAHLMLAWSYRFIDIREADPSPRALAALDRALETKEFASRVERAFIQGCSHFFRRQDQEAIPFFRYILEIQPEHRYASNNLHQIASRQNNVDLIVELYLSGPTRNRILLLVQTSGDIEAAIEFSKVQHQIKIPRQPWERRDGIVLDQRHYLLADLKAFDIWLLWNQGRYQEVQASLTSFSSQVAAMHEEGLDVSNLGYAHWLAALQTLLGQLSGAQRTAVTYSLQPGSENFFSFVSQLAVFRAFLEESVRPLGVLPPDSHYWDEWRNLDPWQYWDYLIATLSFDRDFADAYHQASSGRLIPFYQKGVSVFQAQDPTERIERLEAFIKELPPNQRLGLGSFALRWILSRELSRVGREEEAIRTLEALVSDRNKAFGRGVIWQKAALDLARAYLAQDRLDAAKPLLTDLADMLQFADPDHPIRKAVESLHAHALTASQPPFQQRSEVQQ